MAVQPSPHYDKGCPAFKPFWIIKIAIQNSIENSIENSTDFWCFFIFFSFSIFNLEINLGNLRKQQIYWKRVFNADWICANTNRQIEVFQSIGAEPYRISRIAYADVSIRAVRDESFSSQVGVEHFFPWQWWWQSWAWVLHFIVAPGHLCDTNERDISIYDGVDMGMQCRDDRLQALIAQYVTHVELMARISIMFVL